MKQKMSKKTVIIITALIAVLVIAAGVLGYQKYNENLIAENVKERKEKITVAYSKFEKETDREKKLAVLEEMVKASAEYEKDESKFGNQQSVKDSYTKAISDMKKWFVQDFENSITKETIDDETLAAETDKEKIRTAKTNLETLMETINREKEIVLAKEESENYSTSINDLMAKYDARVKAIEEEEQRKAEEEAAKKKAEEEAAKKAEEEKKAAEEVAKQQANNSGSSASAGSSNSGVSSGSGSSSGGSSSNGGGAGSSSGESSGSSNDDMQHTWWNDGNGNKVEGSDTWTDSNGNVYNENGDLEFNMGDWFDKVE